MEASYRQLLNRKPKSRTGKKRATSQDEDKDKSSNKLAKVRALKSKYVATKPKVILAKSAA